MAWTEGTVKIYLYVVADARQGRTRAALRGGGGAVRAAGAKVTRAFEDTCVWLAAHATFTVLTAPLRVSWRTVAAVVSRVVADLAGAAERLDGLRRIGLDEISARHEALSVRTVADLRPSAGGAVG